MWPLTVNSMACPGLSFTDIQAEKYVESAKTKSEGKERESESERETERQRQREVGREKDGQGGRQGEREQVTICF